MEIINITATVIMEKLFDLDNLQKDLPNSEKTHVWVKARIPPYEKYTAFYGSGKFLVTGVKSYDELNRVANNVVSYLKKYGIKNEIREIQINNHVLTEETRFDSSLVDLSSLKSWNVSNVENMRGMFSGCTDLTDLYPLRDWDTSHAINMIGMFNSCTSLSDVSALANWDVSKVTHMDSIFGGCISLTDFSPLDTWDVSNVENMERIFDDCPNIEVYPSWYKE